MGKVEKKRKIPLRTCIYTGFTTSKAGDELMRFVRVKKEDGGFDVVIDTSFDGKSVSGRGAYIKRDLETVDTAQKNPNRLKKALNVETLPENLFEKAKKLVKEA